MVRFFFSFAQNMLFRLPLGLQFGVQQTSFLSRVVMMAGTIACVASIAPTQASAQIRRVYAREEPIDTVAIKAALDAWRTTPITYQATAIDGRTVDLAKLRGKVVAIEFWSLGDCNASWSASNTLGSCSQEETFLKKAYDTYHAKGFEVIRITTDTKPEVKALVDSEAKVNKLPWPIIMDGKGKQNPLMVKYGVRDLPQIFLIDRKGLLVDSGISGFDIEAYVASTVGKK